MDLPIYVQHLLWFFTMALGHVVVLFGAGFLTACFFVALGFVTIGVVRGDAI